VEEAAGGRPAVVQPRERSLWEVQTPWAGAVVVSSPLLENRVGSEEVPRMDCPGWGMEK
jgi:hypothetical protein